MNAKNVDVGLSNTHAIEIVALEADDWSMWRTVRLQALAEAPWAFGSKLEDWQGNGDTEARWRSRFADVPYNAVALIGGEPVGQVGALVHDTASTLLISMWVSPSARGRGVGDSLINAVIEWSSRRAATAVRLNVKTDNHRAISLYERQGFVMRRDIEPEDPTELVMSRNLQDS
jgi:ribosomal protein S18 acetylase RimI-like enzyme